MSDSLKEALIGEARGTIGANRAVLVGGAGLATLIALAVSLWDPGARAPIDLPILCIAVAFAIATIAALLSSRESASLIQRMTAQDLIGVTQNADKTIWLHFRNRRAFRSAVPDVSWADIDAVLPSLPAPKNYARAAIMWGAFLAPLGVGIWLNELPIPAKISEVKSTRGVLELSGKATVASRTNVTIGDSPEYAILKLDDGSGHCLIYVEAAAIPAAAIERARTEPGIAMRAIVRSKKAQVKGSGMADFEVLVAEWFELLESS